MPPLPAFCAEMIVVVVLGRRVPAPPWPSRRGFPGTSLGLRFLDLAGVHCRRDPLQGLTGLRMLTRGRQVVEDVRLREVARHGATGLVHGPELEQADGIA